MNSCSLHSQLFSHTSQTMQPAADNDAPFYSIDDINAYVSSTDDKEGALRKFLEACTSQQLHGNRWLLSRLHPEYLSEVVNWHLSPMDFTTDEIQAFLHDNYRDKEAHGDRRLLSTKICGYCGEHIPLSELFWWCSSCKERKILHHMKCFSDGLRHNNKCSVCGANGIMIGCEPPNIFPIQWESKYSYIYGACERFDEHVAVPFRVRECHRLTR